MRSICMVILMLGIAILCTSCQKQQSSYLQVIPQKSTDIIQLTLHSYDGKSECKNFIQAYGHTFLEMTNLTDYPIEVYQYQVDPHASVTFSWWAVDRHMGIWFNLEPWYIDLYHRYETRSSVSIYIDENDLITISKYMKENDRYSPFDNCSKMSLTCFNLVAEQQEKIPVPLITTPNYVVSQLKQFDECELAKPIALYGEIGYQANTGFQFYHMEEHGK
ncbi:MAG: hypothetical protein NC182_03865 [Prevotella sp.]|nr:hypothetical protein [Staphylococcus sp.]MCM1350316.1 hypothetical protein [Prevotella sp.]